MKQLGKLSVGDVLLDEINGLCPELLNVIPLEFPIAFPHPILPDCLIFILSDPPHWVKKFVNAHYV